MPTTAGMTVLVTSSTRCSIALSSLIDSGEAEIGLAKADSVSGLEGLVAGLVAESDALASAGLVVEDSAFALAAGLVLRSSARRTCGIAKSAADKTTVNIGRTNRLNTRGMNQLRSSVNTVFTHDPRRRRLVRPMLTVVLSAAL